MRNSPITTSPRRLLIACAALASIGFASVTQADTLEKIKDSNSVRIGYANETPFAYTALDGSVTGESPEIVRKVFERMEIGTIKPVLTEWGSLIPGLRAGRFDLIAAGMYITPERCKQVLFTDPHYRLLDTLLVAGAWRDIHRLQGLSRDFLVLSLPAEVAEVAPAARKAPYALLSLAVMVALMVSGLVPNVQAALIA